MRPLVSEQPWGIFFVKFEPKRLPVVALRRILGQVALKKRASANTSDRQAWAADDLLFNEVIWKAVKGADSPMPPPRRSAFVRVFDGE